MRSYDPPSPFVRMGRACADQREEAKPSFAEQATRGLGGGARPRVAYSILRRGIIPQPCKSCERMRRCHYASAA